MKEPLVAKKLVLVAFAMMLFVPPWYVEKKFEEEALPMRRVVIVPDAEFKFCSVDEPETKSDVPVAFVKLSWDAVRFARSARKEYKSVEVADVVVPEAMVAPPINALVMFPVVLVKMVEKKFVAVALVRSARPSVLDALLKFWMVEDAVEMSPPVLKMCSPVQVGAMDWESAGEASLLMKVKAEPLFAVSPMVALGFAPTAEVVRHVVPS